MRILFESRINSDAKVLTENPHKRAPLPRSLEHRRGSNLQRNEDTSELCNNSNYASRAAEKGWRRPLEIWRREDELKILYEYRDEAKLRREQETKRHHRLMEMIILVLTKNS